MAAATEKSSSWVDMMEDEGYRPFYMPKEEEEGKEKDANQHQSTSEVEQPESPSFDNEEDYVYNEADGEWYYIGTDVSLDNLDSLPEDHRDEDEDNYIYNESDGTWYYVGPEPQNNRDSRSHQKSKDKTPQHKHKHKYEQQQQQHQKKRHRNKQNHHDFDVGHTKDSSLKVVVGADGHRSISWEESAAGPTAQHPESFQVTVDTKKHQRTVRGRGEVKYGKEEVELGGDYIEPEDHGDRDQSQRHPKEGSEHKRGVKSRGKGKSRGNDRGRGKGKGKGRGGKPYDYVVEGTENTTTDANDGWGEDANVTYI